MDLATLKARYEVQVAANQSVSKNNRRYSDDFKRDVVEYLTQNGEKRSLAAWIGVEVKSLENWVRDRPKKSQTPSSFVLVSQDQKESRFLEITYPSGTTLRVPLKL